nr:tellurium resistance protein TerC [Alteromonas sp. MMG017]
MFQLAGKVIVKIVRLTLGGILFIGGIILTLLPGSILLVIGGLVLLSYDWPRARGWLKISQNMMTSSARRIDRILLMRKLR